MTLPRTGQRKVGSALVASLAALTGLASAAGSSAVGLAWARRALCGGPAAATRVTGAGATATAGWAAATAAGAAASGAALAVLVPGTVSFEPSLSGADAL